MVDVIGRNSSILITLNCAKISSIPLIRNRIVVNLESSRKEGERKVVVGTINSLLLRLLYAHFLRVLVCFLRNYIGFFMLVSIIPLSTLDVAARSVL